MTGSMPERPTLESVARAASVSRQTVSNVLNAPHLVRPETLERVRAVIDEQGYRPHQAARTLRTRRSHLIAAPMHAPIDGIGGAVLDSFIHALTLRAQDLSYRVMLFTASEDKTEIATYDELLSDHNLDAFVLTGTHVGDERTAWLSERGATFITFGRPWGTTAHHGWVDVDGAAGMYDATRHLIGRGHRRIAFVGWPQGSGVGDDRRSGWQRACDESGLDTAGLSRTVLDSLPTGRAAGAQLMDSADPPTALVCVSDSLALGVWTEITARGRTPGRDVAVVGFDDSPTASVIGLSSVAQPVDDVARACLRLMEQVIEEEEPTGQPPAPVLLTPSLVVRGTS
jgi:DNA-binding LacI/PurR family transcriptional regulator